ncbi:alpha/beta fold hydrolase [Streptomyces fuscigenes]|uniref:alpha/beta fold hydrolase n=1 Tax=Streptomyces fuscigenes TaxID=1528880 RepID=UPI001F1DA311|nr:alpha/beta hydrolase [Streptomyces fuscigenes]MCF3965507.1 alpha/beta hydrolase [Streptomyces fuscigenes]
MTNGGEEVDAEEVVLSSGRWGPLAGDSIGLGPAPGAAHRGAAAVETGPPGPAGGDAVLTDVGPGPDGAGAVYGRGRSVVLLHGLTFDRAMWRPVLSRLPLGHPALALDLPGHGGSPPLDDGDHGLDSVVDAVHQAVLAAGLDRPVVVGHSLAGLFATAYGARHPATAVVNVDQPLRVDDFARFAQSIAPRLRGEDFAETWAVLQARMRTENVGATYRGLLRAGDTVSQEIVLSYWAELLDLRVPDLAARTDEMLARLRERGIPYVAVFGDPVDPEERGWLVERLPATEVVEWPVGHHFPHVTEASRFAALLAGLMAARP